MAGRVDTGGLAALLGVLGAQGGLRAGEGGGERQADMFELQDALPLPLPLPLAPKGASGAKGGRPAGALNKSTEAWAGYILSGHRSPLAVLAQMATRDTGELVDELQAMADKHCRERVSASGRVEEQKVLVDPLGVLKLQRDAAVALAPYLHKQQARAIEIEQRQPGMVIMPDLLVEDAQMADDGVGLPFAQDEQNQGVGAALEARSENARSEAGQNASGGNGLGDDRA